MTASGARAPARAVGIVAALAAAVAVAGCGHPAPGGAPAVAGQGAPAAAASDPAAAQRLHRALLSATELPLGFALEDSAEPSAIGCAAIDRAYLDPGSTARASVSFGHAISHAFVNETILLQPKAAAANVAAFGRAATDCAAFTGAQSGSYRVAALAGIGRYGDATGAVRVTATAREARPVDLVAVALGDMVVVIANADAGRVDSGLTRTIVQRAVDKITQQG